MNRYTLVFVAILSTTFFACTQKEKTKNTFKISGEGKAQAPYLTVNHEGSPVVCWAEMNETDSLYYLKYAILDTLTFQFGKPVLVSTSKGLNPSAESIPKIAFKPDGTIVGVFAKRFENERNPYAGAICYTLSADQGKSWSPATYIHSDTSHAYGRSFFDVANTQDGEVAAIWLDGRFGKKEQGSALFFSKTSGTKGFSNETLLSKSTCECCRTDLLCDNTGTFHIAFRSISYPPKMLGKQVRDIAYLQINQEHATMETPTPLSSDDWAIEGCPHTGPTLAFNKSGLHAVWFTAGGSPGIYYTSSPPLAVEFKRKTLLSATGRHPQVVASGEQNLALVYDESKSQETESHHHTSPSSAQNSITRSKIVLQVLGTPGKSMEISNGHYTDHHPVIAAANNRYIIAWVREENSKSSVYFCSVEI